MPYIGVSPQFGVRRKHTYTATAGQTSFSGAGSEGATLSYTDSNFVDVYQNGVKLGDADYTSTSGTAIVLAQGASVDDLIEIIVFDAFSAADTVSKADGGTFDGNVTMAGTLAVTGATTLTGGVSGNIANVSGDMTIDVAGDITLDADGADIKLADNGTVFGELTNSSSYLVIKNPIQDQDIEIKGNDGGSEITAVRFDMSDGGRAVFNNGISIGGSGSANTLDDYEEGTWTPGFTGGASGTTSVAVGKYVKIGGMVYFSFRFAWSSGSSLNNLMGGLPFTVESNSLASDYWMSVTPYVNSGFGSLPSGKGYINGYCDRGTTQIYWSFHPNTATANLQTSGNIYACGYYKTAS